MTADEAAHDALAELGEPLLAAAARVLGRVAARPEDDLARLGIAAAAALEAAGHHALARVVRDRAWSPGWREVGSSGRWIGGNAFRTIDLAGVDRTTAEVRALCPASPAYPVDRPPAAVELPVLRFYPYRFALGHLPGHSISPTLLVGRCTRCSTWYVG
jgi:hypothetical protein